ncbi:hypothetical protein [Hymenobacter latericus]|uniref:hypothetical protein n=1 Tax=Hymenobacter sp. YIM 151858-1 TaxID=2987688 RepID=UPI002226F80F|nr:hypothetical protein [Hymenobacter sp. YIM 151858-1]UYZ58226.1 hypothetical protein OIS50_14315 [Hymenobacter sp. YIM 151858-1]
MITSTAAASSFVVDAGAQVNGATLGVVLKAFRIPQQAQNLLKKHGLPANPDRNAWYSLQAWLDLLGDLGEEYGSTTQYAAGLEVVEQCVWPAGLGSLPQAIEALDAALRCNIQGGNIGYYRSTVAGRHEIIVECFTPAPPDYECGIIMGLARKFKPATAIRVFVTREQPRQSDPEALKRFKVSWR